MYSINISFIHMLTDHILMTSYNAGARGSFWYTIQNRNGHMFLVLKSFRARLSDVIRERLWCVVDLRSNHVPCLDEGSQRTKLSFTIVSVVTTDQAK